jgi:hypothetical protein
MRTRDHRPGSFRAQPWLALALVLTAAAAGAAEPVNIGSASRIPPSIDGAAKPRIGRIFFSPAERRSRRTSALAAATPVGSGSAVRVRRVVNGALRAGTEGRAVWVNGTAVDDSARDKSAWTDRNGNVWVMNGTQGTHLLKPGQSIDRNGVIEDLLPPGAVAGR